MANVISPRELKSLLDSDPGLPVLDVRTPVEFEQIHVAGAVNVPLDVLTPDALQSALPKATEHPFYILCRSGTRADLASVKLSAAGLKDGVVVKGGTLAWKEAGYPLVEGTSRVISLERQVRIAAGALVLTGVVLGRFVHPWLLGLSAFVGAGLVFAGITDWCGMGLLLAKAPLESTPAISTRSHPASLSPVDWHLPELLASYERFGGLNQSVATNLPSKRAVSRICEDLLQLLFPGFHDDEAIHDGTLEQLTAERLMSVIRRLQEQVRKSVRIGNPTQPTGRTVPIMRRFVKAIPAVRELLKHDVEAALEGDPSVRLQEEIILSFPFMEAIAIQRLAHRLYREGALIIPRMMTEWAHARTGIDIHPGASIGSHFFIDHGTGVVIGETCIIGNHVKLYHGVTLGARSFAKDETGNLVKGTKRHPNVEDGVTIYPNSTILGGDTVIGENSTIGANVFLMHSVPPNSLVVYEEKQLSILDKNARRKKAGALEFTI